MTEQRIAEIVLYHKHGYSRYFPEWSHKTWKELLPVFDEPHWRYDEETLLEIVEASDDE